MRPKINTLVLELLSVSVHREAHRTQKQTQISLLWQVQDVLICLCTLVLD